MELNHVQRATIIAALRKELEQEEKVYRQMADADLLTMNARTGAKTFDVNLETTDKRVPIGVASVATRDGSWEVVDIDAFIDGAADAGLVEYRITVAPERFDEVREALIAAGLEGVCTLEAKPVRGWESGTTEVGGKLVFTETGETVDGVEYVPGKQYTIIRPKSGAIIRQAATMLYNTTPFALLEGGRDA